jgi:hypothetical protein
MPERCRARGFDSCVEPCADCGWEDPVLPPWVPRGYYADPADPTHGRFWSGERWTGMSVVAGGLDTSATVSEWADGAEVAVAGRVDTDAGRGLFDIGHAATAVAEQVLTQLRAVVADGPQREDAARPGSYPLASRARVRCRRALAAFPHPDIEHHRRVPEREAS